jgi:Rad3-related DNA helicase
MSSAAKAIAEISLYMELAYDADKVVVHCGNIGTHATSIYKVLGEQDCVLHESGKLAETIEKYLKSGKKYLLVAAAEHGGDFGWCKLQFILKFPYPSLDERMRTLERSMGPEFKAYYEGEARTRVIQMAGRNVRGFDDFGITVCLDSKVQEDYFKNMNKYPLWFQERVDRRCY